MDVSSSRAKHRRVLTIHTAIVRWRKSNTKPCWQRHLCTAITASLIPICFIGHGEYTHRKEVMFAQWGYTAADARWLQAEMERHAKVKYLAGEYTLGKLNKDGQRISIRIEIPRKNGTGMVSFVSGWMVCPNGRIRLTTPYGGK